MVECAPNIPGSTLFTNCGAITSHYNINFDKLTVSCNKSKCLIKGKTKQWVPEVSVVKCSRNEYNYRGTSIEAWPAGSITKGKNSHHMIKSFTLFSLWSFLQILHKCRSSWNTSFLHQSSMFPVRRWQRCILHSTVYKSCLSTKSMESQRKTNQIRLRLESAFLWWI